MKQCKKCLLIKSYGDFYKDNSSKDGLHSWCKICNGEHVKSYQQANRDKINEKQRTRRKNLEKLNPKEYAYQLEKNSRRLRTYRDTPEGRAATMWAGMCNRVRNKYKGISIKCSRDEFINWAIPEIAYFMQNNHDETPSVDRIDSHGHYEFGNMRIISLRENVIRSSMLTRKLALNTDSEKLVVFERLTEAIGSICYHTNQSMAEFVEYLLHNNYNSTP